MRPLVGIGVGAWGHFVEQVAPALCAASSPLLMEVELLPVCVSVVGYCCGCWCAHTTIMRPYMKSEGATSPKRAGVATIHEAQATLMDPTQAALAAFAGVQDVPNWAEIREAL